MERCKAGRQCRTTGSLHREEFVVQGGMQGEATLHAKECRAEGGIARRHIWGCVGWCMGQDLVLQ